MNNSLSVVKVYTLSYRVDENSSYEIRVFYRKVIRDGFGCGLKCITQYSGEAFAIIDDSGQANIISGVGAYPIE